MEVALRAPGHAAAAAKKGARAKAKVSQCLKMVEIVDTWLRSCASVRDQIWVLRKQLRTEDEPKEKSKDKKEKKAAKKAKRMELEELLRFEQWPCVKGEE